MKSYILVVAFCTLGVLAQDSFESQSVRFILKIYDECANSEGFSPCLKKKAVTFLDRVARMDKLPLMDGVSLVKSKDAIQEPQIAENEIEENLPRSLEGQDEALNNLLSDRVTNLLGSRTIEISMPNISEMIEEGRKGGGGGGGGGGKGGGGKMKDMMGGMMMAIAAKMAALIPIAIAGLFLLAGKALITAKIALLISGIIALKKLFAAKQHGGSHHGGGWSSGGGGGGGGWQSSGGGWDKRSIEAAQQLAYKPYKQA
ncbi:unnamed protein product [Ceutorhynchus assimilis]|uniref:Uncharacterized protein n=1 Tax=Ceutorhynchus assimilis TaxID=467358 RepID=A0A9N9MFH4_9CUCU|nr:unnamed protein product [Ceutorhynchus assimilis]